MQPKRSAHTMAALMILAAFAVGMMGCLVSGAGSYRRLSARSAQSYDRRTASAYLTTQVRRAEQVSVEPFGEGMALCLYQKIEQVEYVTRIYCHDGWLMELFAREGSSFFPEDGEPVLALEDLEVQLQGGMLTLLFEDHQGMQTLKLKVEVCHEE